MNNGKTRSALLGLVAAYMLYTAYGLYQNDTETTMSPTVRTLFIVLFVLAGIGVAVYAYFVWKNSEKKKEEEQKQNDQDSMK